MENISVESDATDRPIAILIRPSTIALVQSPRNKSKLKTVFAIQISEHKKQQHASVLWTFLDRNEQLTVDQIHDKYGSSEDQLDHAQCILCYGILGFLQRNHEIGIQIVESMSVAAIIGGRAIYKIETTRIIWKQVPDAINIRRDWSESMPKSQYWHARPFGISVESTEKYLRGFKSLQSFKNLFFSYDYNLTLTLQDNIRCLLERRSERNDNWYSQFQNMYIWNHKPIDTAYKIFPKSSGWCLPIIHGSIGQVRYIGCGRPVSITLIARRSRFQAGTRFFKRGVGIDGYVANEVETEQIVIDELTTPFLLRKRFFSPRFTSYTQLRGSIPVFWSQEANYISPKPMIELKYAELEFDATLLHFTDLFRRYGAPCFALNLVKTKERLKREGIVASEYDTAIKYLNQILPSEKKIRYLAWDMAKTNKSGPEVVIVVLEEILRREAKDIHFFHAEDAQTAVCQSGIVRTNCIDNLDRTNAAQFVLGKILLEKQLYHLGLLDSPQLDYSSFEVKALMHLYNTHGDTIALQYGGSHLVNRVESYQKNKRWNLPSRDLVTNLQRYYSNSFVDAFKQEAIDWYLGATGEGNFAHLSSQQIREDALNCQSFVEETIHIGDEARESTSDGHTDFLWDQYYDRSTYVNLESLIFNLVIGRDVPQKISLSAYQKNQTSGTRAPSEFQNPLEIYASEHRNTGLPKDSNYHAIDALSSSELFHDDRHLCQQSTGLNVDDVYLTAVRDVLKPSKDCTVLNMESFIAHKRIIEEEFDHQWERFQQVLVV